MLAFAKHPAGDNSGSAPMFSLRSSLWEDESRCEYGSVLASLAKSGLLKTAGLKPPSTHDLVIFVNFFARLFSRQRKYLDRGIELIGRPDEFKAFEYMSPITMDRAR